MDLLNANEKIVATGTFVHAGHECALRIIFNPVRYGSGDDEDEAEIADDRTVDTFYIQYGSTTQPDVFNAGGGGHPSLAAARSAAEAAPGIGSTVRWGSDTA